MKKKTEDLCVLATDFSAVNKHMENFEKQIEKKEIYIMLFLNIFYV